jgi:hypothetical protein
MQITTDELIEKNYAKPYPNAICIGLAINDSVRQITDKKILEQPTQQFN